MNLAILHYHLNPGGVTRVIASHLLALDSILEADDRWRVVVFHGGRAAGWPPNLASQLKHIDLELHVIPELEYDAERTHSLGSVLPAIASRLKSYGFEASNTLLHVHNHSLGKNADLLPALCSLIRDGYPCLLQPHDFAEDFRSANYRHLVHTLGRDVFEQSAYPIAENVHYALLNRRDRTILQTAGVPSKQLHFLPNPVDEVPTSNRQESREQLDQKLGVRDSETYLLYPVRGIRRKNLGEFVLWSEVLRKRAIKLGITLTPLNPIEKNYYDSWRNYAQEHALPCVFGAGDDNGLAFADNMAAADAILTTSVAEGFGMVFLEAWLAGRPLLGRNLPTVTADFEDQGVEFPTLYDSCEVKVDWFDFKRYQRVFGDTVLDLSKSYERLPPNPREIQTAIESHIHDGWIDYGDLDELMQSQVIDFIRENKPACEEFEARHAEVIESFTSLEVGSLVKTNANRVRTAYGLQASGRNLFEIYQSVISSDPTSIVGHLPAEMVLEQFLDYRNLRLIRT
ncbi:glycosyltransferase family 4 protein [Thalassoroseus pseudoceratinae]|uniref:glycosyltransferase family 4 protein n=1 Tax=Thalassoroseus pseudoceratinae TaxID=2713176 RepID=UPI00141DDE69|nr:glycosyltransferase family 4 protein [Thalassoroseus pseudoceratinae]